MLFKRSSKAPAFEDDDAPISVPNIPIPAKGAKRPLRAIELDDSEDEDAEINKRTQKGTKVVESQGQKENADRSYLSRARMETAKAPASTNLPGKPKESSTDDDAIEILDDVSASKARSKPVLAAPGRATSLRSQRSSSSSSQNSSQATQPIIMDLDFEPELVLPVVKCGQARYIKAHDPIDLCKLVGTDKDASGGSAPSRAASVGNPQCKFSTRLNGKHEHKWKLGMNEPFSKVFQFCQSLLAHSLHSHLLYVFVRQIKAAFASMYGIISSQAKFEFDGQVIGDSDTPQGLDMEDDVLVDVKVRARDLFDFDPIHIFAC